MNGGFRQRRGRCGEVCRYGSCGILGDGDGKRCNPISWWSERTFAWLLSVTKFCVALTLALTLFALLFHSSSPCSGEPHLRTHLPLTLDPPCDRNASDGCPSRDTIYSQRGCDVQPPCDKAPVSPINNVSLLDLPVWCIQSQRRRLFPSPPFAGYAATIH